MLSPAPGWPGSMSSHDLLPCPHRCPQCHHPGGSHGAGANGAVRGAGGAAVPGAGCPGCADVPCLGWATRWVPGPSWLLGVPGLPATGWLREWALGDPGDAHGLVVSAAVTPEPGKAVDAVYEELDYTVMPEYQEVPSRPGWCWSPHIGVALPHGPTTALGPGAVALAHSMACCCPLSHCVLPHQAPQRRAQRQSCPITLQRTRRRVTPAAPQVGTWGQDPSGDPP